MRHLSNSRFLAIAISVSLLGSATYLLGWSSLFNVERILLKGAPTTQSEKAISQTIGISIGTKMARVHTRSIENRLMRFAWIESVEISRHWFSGELSLKVKPRTPIALYNSTPDKVEWIDQSGETFSLPGSGEKNLPRVQATSAGNGLAAIALFTALPEEFRSQIDLITALSSENFLMSLQYKARDIRLIWGDGEDTELKVAVFNELLGMAENKSISMIDLSAPHAPIVK